jgi:hypothetical protein
MAHLHYGDVSSPHYSILPRLFKRRRRVSAHILSLLLAHTLPPSGHVTLSSLISTRRASRRRFPNSLSSASPYCRTAAAVPFNVARRSSPTPSSSALLSVETRRSSVRAAQRSCSFSARRPLPRTNTVSLSACLDVASCAPICPLRKYNKVEDEHDLF